MLLHLHPVNPPPKSLRPIIECLQNDGVIIYPTDTLYGFGCNIYSQPAIERICRIKQVDPQKAQLSLVCHDLSDLSKYTKSISNSYFRILKSYLPGPYTFVLPASKEVPKIFKNKKNTIGLRVPGNDIARAIVQELGNPILSTSLPGEMVEEYTDPDWIYEKFQKQVDVVVSGGIGGLEFSTIVDLTGDEPVILRQGVGEFAI